MQSVEEAVQGGWREREEGAVAQIHLRAGHDDGDLARLAEHLAWLKRDRESGVSIPHSGDSQIRPTLIGDETLDDDAVHHQVQRNSLTRCTEVQRPARYRAGLDLVDEPGETDMVCRDRDGVPRQRPSGDPRHDLRRLVRRDRRQQGERETVGRHGRSPLGEAAGDGTGAGRTFHPDPVSQPVRGETPGHSTIQDAECRHAEIDRRPEIMGRAQHGAPRPHIHQIELLGERQDGQIERKGQTAAASTGRGARRIGDVTAVQQDSKGHLLGQIFSLGLNAHPQRSSLA